MILGRVEVVKKEVGTPIKYIYKRTSLTDSLEVKNYVNIAVTSALVRAVYPNGFSKEE